MIGHVDQVGWAKQYTYAEERATSRIARELTLGGCVSADATARTLSHALRGWKPGRDAVGLVQACAGVGLESAQLAVRGWLVGIDEHVRVLDALSRRHGVYTPQGQVVAAEARALTQHAAALRGSL